MVGLLFVGAANGAAPIPMARAEIANMVKPPYALGDPVAENGVYALLNSGGEDIGYVFETGPLAPLPGFSGAPIDLLVLMDKAGTLIDVRLLSQREPVFVSGLGEAPFREFLAQYPGLSITQSLVVGVPYGDGDSGSDLVYLDGVTKATASVRIAHESLLAAALAVARDKMQGLSTSAPARPDPIYDEMLTWDDLVEQGIARNLRVSNAEVDAAFQNTLWAHDDPDAKSDPEGSFLDLWLVDVGPTAIARAVLASGTVEELARFMEISPEAEPLLVIDNGRHGLVSDDFVRNTAPDRISAEQNGFPVALRDADIWVDLAQGVPEASSAMILSADRRLGFDPVSEWQLDVQAVRAHGMFQPEIGDTHFSVVYEAPERFFITSEVQKPLPPWVEALRSRQLDMALLGMFLAALIALVGPRMHWTAQPERLTPIRLGVLAATVGFVGWWGQGQLSIVTVLATLRAAMGQGSLAVLLYDPFSLLIWMVALAGLFLWGRGLFCGWLCPFGAMQEFAHHIARRLRVKQIEPSARWDRRLKSLKYVALAGLVAVSVFAPEHTEKAAEIEPFKTAVIVFFVREWYYVVYAAFWLLLGMVLYKGFCRYLCPLGAFFALGGVVRGRDWIERRSECGSPCQLCRVKCRYGAIKPSGAIQYSECFQCLDCVQIFDDPDQCVPRIVERKRKERAA